MLKIVEKCVEKYGDTHTHTHRDRKTRRGRHTRGKAQTKNRMWTTLPKEGCAFHLYFMSLGKKTELMSVTVASRPPYCPPCQPPT